MPRAGLVYCIFKINLAILHMLPKNRSGMLSPEPEFWRMKSETGITSTTIQNQIWCLLMLVLFWPVITSPTGNTTMMKNAVWWLFVKISIFREKNKKIFILSDSTMFTHSHNGPAVAERYCGRTPRAATAIGPMIRNEWKLKTQLTDCTVDRPMVSINGGLNDWIL